MALPTSLCPPPTNTPGWAGAGREVRRRALGVLVTLQPPTRDMRDEAATAGFYVLPYDETKKYPRIQILTIEDLLVHKRQIECAPLHYTSRSYAQAAPLQRQSQDTALDFDQGETEG